jgi:hypothetical protein
MDTKPRTGERRWLTLAVTLGLVACQGESTTKGADPDVDASGATGGSPVGGAGGQAAGGQSEGGRPVPADAQTPATDLQAPVADAHLSVDAGSPRPDAGDASPPPADAALPALAAGRTCVEPLDCGPGYTCQTEIVDGYCLPGAPGGPMACRPGEVECPEGTRCSPLPWHQISGVCLQACATTDDCRPGLVCGSVPLFPGDPQSPQSDGSVCWVRLVCQPGADQTCNDDPVISSIHGRCRFDGTCECLEGFAPNPETGRCR